MQRYLLKYSIGLALISMVCIAGGHYIIHSVLNAKLGLIYPFSVVLLFLISVAVQIILARSNKIKAQAFIRSYMLSSSAKLFLYLAFMMAYAISHKDRAVAFILAFFVLYVIFTAYDVVMSNRFFGKN